MNAAEWMKALGPALPHAFNCFSAQMQKDENTTDPLQGRRLYVCKINPDSLCVQYPPTDQSHGCTSAGRICYVNQLS